MTIFIPTAEHVHPSRHNEIKAWCKEQKIRVTKLEPDAYFTNVVRIRVSGDTRRVANKVRKFIWEEINGGTSCSITRVASQALKK